MGGEVQDRVIGKPTLFGEVLELRLRSVGTEQDLAIGNTEPAPDCAQLISGLREWRHLSHLIDVRLSAAKELGGDSRLGRLGDEHIERQASEWPRGDDEKVLTLDQVFDGAKERLVEFMGAGDIEG